MEKIQIKNKYFSPSIFRFGTKIKCSGFLTKELRVASYVLRVTSYYLLHEVRVTFSCRVTSFFLHIAGVTSYYLLHECRVPFTNELLFIARVTS